MPKYQLQIKYNGTDEWVDDEEFYENNGSLASYYAGKREKLLNKALDTCIVRAKLISKKGEK